MVAGGFTGIALIEESCHGNSSQLENRFLMAYSRTTAEAAKALNCLLHFSGKDQQALVEVIQDYFTNERDSDNSDDSDVEFNLDKGKVHRKNRILTMQRIRHTIGHTINVFF